MCVRIVSVLGTQGLAVAGAFSMKSFLTVSSHSSALWRSLIKDEALHSGEQRNALLLSESRQLWLSKAMHLARISQHHLCLQPFGIVESLETY
ncbi:hypothetical protein Y1Q_0023857 [Alligator mississippiensis]|uniref:Uncharacterized protein n=1 Tax=Alligator mississippiensis TaxID=8496 RepID=A0A151MKG7_ALLMI|nr:hypothetical protein Y1Q_0023857 [Alligator mississippiensis]